MVARFARHRQYMRTIRLLATLAAFTVAVTGCGAAPPPPPMDPALAKVAAEPAVSALQRGEFTVAADAADHALQANRGNSIAAAVRALAGYQRAGERLRDELEGLVESYVRDRKFDHPRGRAAWRDFASALDTVDADLAIAERDPAFALELCLACWAHDWNHTGEVDDGDRLMLQIEVDERGDELPEGDPRRTPTFRFDAGDIAWARAMVAFQRAAVEIVLGYDWHGLDQLAGLAERGERITIRVSDADRIRRARELIRTGLAFSDRSRELYLAETDDDREWVPNPRQVNHPVPLVMDDAMYATWAAVTRDVRALIDGREGLDLGEILGTRSGAVGFVDVGELFDHPHDVTIDLEGLDDDNGVSPVLALARQILGTAIVPRMSRSPLVARLLRMAREIDSDQDTFGRKLRYFLWIN
jgi:hypothetical protein